MAQEFLAELPAAIVSTDADDLAPHLKDWRGTKEGRAIALLRPRDVPEVQQIVCWANRYRIALVPQGGNTGLVGGSVPEADGPLPAVVLSLRRMNRVLQIDRHGLSMEVEAGAILEHVHEAAANAGCRFPLSLGSRGSATIGGLVSTNAGGVQVLRHGPMRSLVLGLEAVLPDGTLLDQLSALRKDNSGYDVKQLLIGAEGTLGVVTKVSLRLSPPLGDVTTVWAAVPTAEAALLLLSRLRAGLGERIESFELLSREALDLVLEKLPGTRRPVQEASDFHVLVELETRREPVESLLMTAIEAGEVLDASLALSNAQAADFWSIREHVSVAERIEGVSVKNDIAVPVARVAEFNRRAHALFADLYPGARPLVFGHLGDGNLHWNLRPPKGVEAGPWVDAHGNTARHGLHDLVLGFGGTISAEHGIGTLKAGELSRLGNPGKLAAMRAIKQALDPAGICNPGKLFA